MSEDVRPGVLLDACGAARDAYSAQERFERARQTIGLILIVLLIPVMANLVGFV